MAKPVHDKGPWSYLNLALKMNPILFRPRMGFIKWDLKSLI